MQRNYDIIVVGGGHAGCEAANIVAFKNKKVALVTGGSRGIGKACALELAASGCDVVINYAGNVDAANQTVEELKALDLDLKKRAQQKFEEYKRIAKPLTTYFTVSIIMDFKDFKKSDIQPFIR